MKILGVVQARMGSTRLPGKVLMDLGGRPMLEFLLARLQAAPFDETVVATSTLVIDDPVAEVAERAGVAVVRGDEQDVLGRFGLALDRHPADHLVRITGDCPLADPVLIGDVVDLHVGTGADYTCNVLPRTFPKGLDVEVVRAEALRVALTDALSGPEREHVTPFLYRRPSRFRLANLRNDEPLGEERWTVDTAEDLSFVRSVVDALGADGSFGWREVFAWAGRREGRGPGELALRPAVMRDRDLLLELRNDPVAVEYSGSGRPVTPDEHEAWLAAVVVDPARRLWIGEVDKRPVGSVRVDVDDGVGVISIAVVPAERGHGMARRLLAALDGTLAEDQQVVSLLARVKPDNAASRRAFTSAGFRAEGEAGGFEELRRSRGGTISSTPSPS